jgi:prolipoprotein diacylglyceryl transferase
VTPADVVLGIPSPSSGVWYLGPLPVRAYALLVLSGIVIGTVIARRRWRARGGDADTVVDVLLWAVPAGVVGARVWHVVSRWDAYAADPWSALRVWEGGLAIFGGLLGGSVAAVVVCRRRGVAIGAFADALAPGLAVGQAVGRWGNWFNQELFGGPTSLPWGVRIDPANRPPEHPDVETFHPTFLYESLWNLAVAAVLVWADRRFRLGHGRVFLLYLVLYGTGRVLTEVLRTDPATLVLGVRWNQLAALLVALAAAVAFAVQTRRRPGREVHVERPPARRDPSSDTTGGRTPTRTLADGALLRPLQVEDLHDTARLHSLLLPDGFFLQLGHRFVVRWHRTFVDRATAVGAVVTPASGSPVLAFVLASTDQVAYTRDVLGRDRGPLLLLGSLGLLRRPLLLAAFVRTRTRRYARRLLGRRRGAGPPSGRSDPTPPRLAVVHAVATTPEHRGRGYAAALLQHVLDSARAAGAVECALVTAAVETVTADPQPRGAAAMYERLGWRLTDRRRQADGRWVAEYRRAL